MDTVIVYAHVCFLDSNKPSVSDYCRELVLHSYMRSNDGPVGECLLLVPAMQYIRTSHALSPDVWYADGASLKSKHALRCT